MSLASIKVLPTLKLTKLSGSEKEFVKRYVTVTGVMVLTTYTIQNNKISSWYCTLVSNTSVTVIWRCVCSVSTSSITITWRSIAAWRWTGSIPAWRGSGSATGWRPGSRTTSVWRRGWTRPKIQNKIVDFVL